MTIVPFAGWWKKRSLALERETPDVLISDIRMPGISGIELLNQVNERSPDLPVIIMTAHSDLDAAVNAYQQGAFEYLPKPFDVDQKLLVKHPQCKRCFARLVVSLALLFQS